MSDTHDRPALRLVDERDAIPPLSWLLIRDRTRLFLRIAWSRVTGSDIRRDLREVHDEQIELRSQVDRLADALALLVELELQRLDRDRHSAG